ncbi:MAG: STAS domain-containing protein [Deltaproteobacteria bacterium]|nr:STAS domain-containing protein [Deltaproteobacteria bacterium]
MNKDIEVSISNKNDISIIAIRGDVTAITGEAIEKAYQKVSADGTKKVLLCFDKDSYINSGGIAILIGIAAESRENDQTIRITGLSDHFQKIFSMVGLTKYTEIFPSEEAALKDF